MHTGLEGLLVLHKCVFQHAPKNKDPLSPTMYYGGARVCWLSAQILLLRFVPNPKRRSPSTEASCGRPRIRHKLETTMKYRLARRKSKQQRAKRFWKDAHLAWIRLLAVVMVLPFAFAIRKWDSEPTFSSISDCA
jgi:hypothetical protein